MQLLSYAPLIIFLILLWMRPEYRFLLFYVFANAALVLLFTWLASPETLAYTLVVLIFNDLILLVIGAVVVTLRKWLKSRKSGAERRAEALLADIRAEEAAQRKVSGA